MTDPASSSAYDPAPAAYSGMARGRRGRWLAAVIGVAALLVLGAAGWVFRDHFLEPWYVGRLEGASEEERVLLVERLTEVGSTRAVPIFLRWAMEPKTVVDRTVQPYVLRGPMKHVQIALQSPRLTPGLAAVVADDAQPPAVRRSAVELLARRRYPFESLQGALLDALNEGPDDLRRDAARALAASLPDDPRPALRALDRLLPAQRSPSVRTALGCAILLHCAQLPEDERPRWQEQATAALGSIFAPWELSAALGDLTAYRPERQHDPAKVALLASMRPRLEGLLERLVHEETPALRQAAREALQFIERGARPLAKAQDPQ